MRDYPKPPFETPRQPVPGKTDAMNPRPDHGEETYNGSGRLDGKVALITGADSGIGRAVALAYAREGADVFVGYLSETEDAEETKRLVEAAGRACLLFPGDLADREVCRRLVRETVDRFGRIDVLANNAAHQMTFESIEDIPDEEWERTFAVNVSAMFYITKAAAPHMKPGCDHQHRLDQLRQAQSDPSGLRHHQGRHPELHGRPCATAWTEGHTRQRRGSRSDLDAADPLDHAAGEGRDVRRRHPDGTPWPAGRTGARLCPAGLRRG